MTYMTNIQLKKVLRDAIREETGLTTTLKSITLLEASSDGSYVRGSINGHEWAVNNGKISDF